MAVVRSLLSTQDHGTGPFWSHTNHFHALSSYGFKKHFNIILPRMPAFPRKLVHVFPSESLFLTIKKRKFAFTCCWFHVTILSMNFEKCKLWNPSLCSFLWPAGTSCVIGQNIPLISLFSTIHSQNKIKIQLDATVCSLIYFTSKSLYMFRVSQHPSSGVLKTVTAASGTGHSIGTATSLQRG